MADHSILEYYEHFLSAAEADQLFSQLYHEIPWRQDTIQLFGRPHKIPRQQHFQGEPGLLYQYSGLVMHAQPLHPAVGRLKQAIERRCDARFNCVLLNLYRDGGDSMGWHSDDEAELGQNPVIASVTLGTPRRFLLRQREDNSLRREILLGHGSLLLMAGDLQHQWQHSVPKSRKVKSARINLTFRRITG